MSNSITDLRGIGAVLFGVAVLAATLVVAPSARAEEEAAKPAVDVVALWKKNCASCHGVDGKADTKMGKKLSIKDMTDPKVKAEYDRAKMIETTKDGFKNEKGKQVMKPFGKKLSDAEIEALVDHALAFPASGS